MSLIAEFIVEIRRSLRAQVTATSEIKRRQSKGCPESEAEEV